MFEDLSFSGITMRDVNRPLYITATRFNFSAHAKSVRPLVGRIRGLRLNEIEAVARQGDPASPYDRTCAAIVALHDHAIENVTLSNVKFTFPGGGTQEQASRLDVAEMLHFHDYMQWARPFDGELPAAVLYLRHLPACDWRTSGSRSRHPTLAPLSLVMTLMDSRCRTSSAVVPHRRQVWPSWPTPRVSQRKTAASNRETTCPCSFRQLLTKSVDWPTCTSAQAALDKAIQEAADAGRIHSIEPTTSK